MSRIAFETTPYELSHGRSPRGRGCWGFCPFHLRNDASPDDVLLSPSMTFSEAKKWAAAQVAEHRNNRRAAGLPADPWDACLWAVLG